jgi:hypothetical protein
MQRHFVSLCWRALNKLFRNVQWPAIAILVVSAYAAILFIDPARQGWRFVGIPKETMLRLAGSLLSSALFLTLVQLLSALKNMPNSVEAEYFKRMHDHFGIKEVFEQRGGQGALDCYERSLRTVRRRIWAIGMTNKRFMSSHFEVVQEALRRSADMDIRLVFADPRMNLSWEGQAINVIEAQTQMEHKAPTGSDWPKYLDSQVERLRSAYVSTTAGHLQALVLRSVCHFTCFVIDDNVFFFPMLARNDSSQDPTMLVGADTLLGRVLIDHFASILSSATFCGCVYDNRAKSIAEASN